MKNLYFIKITALVLMLVIFVYPECFGAVKAGIDVLATQHPTMVKGKKLAVLTSKSALDANLCHTVDRLAKAAEIKIIITGDSKQVNRKSIKNKQDISGLDYSVEKLEDMEETSITTFTEDDIVRNGLITEILKKWDS